MNVFALILSCTWREMYDCINGRICCGSFGFWLRPKVVGHDLVAM